MSPIRWLERPHTSFKIALSSHACAQVYSQLDTGLYEFTVAAKGAPIGQAASAQVRRPPQLLWPFWQLTDYCVAIDCAQTCMPCNTTPACINLQPICCTSDRVARVLRLDIWTRGNYVPRTFTVANACMPVSMSKRIFLAPQMHLGPRLAAMACRSTPVLRCLCSTQFHSI